jgi:hypothetical protein
VALRIEEDLDLLGKAFHGRPGLPAAEIQRFGRQRPIGDGEKLFRFLQLHVADPTTAFLDTHTQSNNQPAEKRSVFPPSGHGWKTKLSKRRNRPNNQFLRAIFEKRWASLFSKGLLLKIASPIRIRIVA